ncbi:hypothetical protein Glove_187g28 [Diversispora epigaea]|uniref:Uncharacterized protein n=1 Tax=Diversispora epigaea TaxID=1348612 RepID=A0A397IM23_9GLOM|nr:hypothetical protein Glove_187g28 [Diversispora epigaea]
MAHSLANMAIYPPENLKKEVTTISAFLKFPLRHVECLQEALKTIFPQASDKEIGEQLGKVIDFDPVLIVSPNQNWINLTNKIIVEMFSLFNCDRTHSIQYETS